MDEFVTMRHPEIDVPSGPTSRKAFEEIYQAQGWELVGSEVPPIEAPGPDDLTDDPTQTTGPKRLVKNTRAAPAASKKE